MWEAGRCEYPCFMSVEVQRSLPDEKGAVYATLCRRTNLSRWVDHSHGRDGSTDVPLSRKPQCTRAGDLGPFLCQRGQTEDLLHLRWTLPRSYQTGRTAKWPSN